MSGRILLCVALLPALSCVNSRWNECSADLVCPEDRVCDLMYGRCSEPACRERADGEVCTDVDGFVGVCAEGHCGPAPSFPCGDGRVNVTGEECDGRDLRGETCQTLGFYEDTGELRCDTSCQFDTSECVGACLDGFTTRPEEVCDPTDRDAVIGFCGTNGYSAGLLGCSDSCNTVTTDPCVQFGWTVNRAVFAPEDRNRRIVDIWGAEGQLIALGAPADLRWFDGRTWRDWPGGLPTGDGLPASESPKAIWGVSMTDFWIAFRSGLSRWDGTSWSFTVYPNEIDALWGSGESDIFGVGGGGRIHRYDGKRWNAMPLPPGGRGGALHDISGSGPANVYAVGDQSVLRFDGTSWTRVDVGVAQSFTSVWANSSDDVWITARPSSETPYLFRFDGERWQGSRPAADLGSSPIYVAGRDPRDVWLVSGRTALHFDDDGWVRTKAAEFDDSSVEVIWVDRRSTVLASGAEVAAWGGAGEIELDLPSGVEWVNFWGTSATSWVAFSRAVNSGGVAYHKHDESLRPLPESADTDSVVGWGPDNIYIASQTGAVYHFDGANWTPVREESPDFVSLPPQLQIVGRDVYFLRSPYYYQDPKPIYRFDGRDWTSVLVDQSECRAWRMWAFSPDDVWIACRYPEWDPDGPLAHFDGKSTSLTDIVGVVSMWGSGPGDFYALVPPRDLWHYDGSTWDLMKVGLERSSFHHVGGYAADDVFVLGNGDIVHFDGRVWESIESLDIDDRDVPTTMIVTRNAVIAAGQTFPARSARGLLRTRLWNCRDCERDQSNRIDDDCDGHVDETDAGCERWERP